ncbi:MAG: hypothetical protein Q9214_003367 [Letrouitia sp. 1 TL-2023]
MATTSPTSVSRTLTNDLNAYDHAINLVDTTKPKPDIESAAAVEESQLSGAPLSRKWTRGTLRKEIAKRKYAKWQQEKTGSAEDTEEPVESSGEGLSEQESTAQGKRPQRDEGRLGRLQKKTAKEGGKLPAKSKAGPESVIDVLYENQRGWFFCGIPLYSSNSLLNLDPAPWQTSTFKDSPVNITNAQVPDPSWQWEWKTWYVDMSHDVDEEGWEYSFSFQPRFAWHGSHPWFHSFARRRRWLRKRVKMHSLRSSGKRGDMKEAHQLNADYFTIHGAKRSRSPASSAGATATRSSYTYDGHESDSEQDFSDISNVVALLAALRKATVDREKIVAMRAFLGQGGDELYYLADHMEELMDLFVYQTSRQHAYNYILESLEEAQGTLADPPPVAEDSDIEAADRKSKNLDQALRAAKTYLEGLEYWSDSIPRDGRFGKLDALAVGSRETEGEPPAATAEQVKAHIEQETSVTEVEIKGIPEGAETDVAPSPLRTAQQGQAEQASSGSVDKGKGRASD